MKSPRQVRNWHDIVYAFSQLPRSAPAEVFDLFRWVLNHPEQELPGFTPQNRDVPPLDLHELLSTNGHDNSYDHLANCQPPGDFRPLPTLDELCESFEQNHYFIDRDAAFAIHRALQSGKGLLVTGPPGVGKTTIARMIALVLRLDVNNGTHFDHVFCTPDISAEETIYRWNDAKRLMDLQLVNSLLQTRGERLSDRQVMEIYRQVSNNTYSLRYLEIHKLLAACVIPFRTVRLIDEIDKTMPMFDTVLLDLIDLNRFSVPEFPRPIGRSQITDPAVRPVFVLTSNDQRDLAAPLVSRCVPVFFNYLPEILEAKVLHKKTSLTGDDADQVAYFFRKIREQKDLRLRQPPSTREAIETARAMAQINAPCCIQTLFQLNCEWIKNRADYETICKRYHDGTAWSTSL